MNLGKMSFNLLIMGCLTSLLFACSGSEGDDLDQFIASAANDMSMSVAPLPEVLPYTPLEYNADGILSDPFRPRKVAGSAGSLQPNTDRPREALESFPLESLLYVGSLSKKRLKYALIQIPDGALHQVRIGNYLGTNFGLITGINDGAVEIKEVVQDDITGDWVERDASVNLQEQ